MLQVIPKISLYVMYLKEYTRAKLQDICGHFISISHIKPKNIHEAEIDSYWLLAIQVELNQFERSQVWRLVSRPQDRPTIGTSGCLETS